MGPAQAQGQNAPDANSPRRIPVSAIVIAAAAQICPLRREAWMASNVTGVEPDGRSRRLSLLGERAPIEALAVCSRAE